MTLYRERLWPAPWVFLACTLVLPATLLVFWPINALVGVVVAIALFIGCCLGLVAASPTIEVTETELVAGAARLPIIHAGDAQSFEKSEATHERGPGLDARAWLLVRGWVGPVVKVMVTDPADPAPYWLLSTRKPLELTAAVRRAQSSDQVA